MKRFSAQRIGVLLIALLVVSVRAVGAADLRNVLTDYTITSWSLREGLPAGNIWALAQDRDGYLWVGSDAGLLRFDGARFTQWEIAHGHGAEKPVRALYVARDGIVWVGFGDSGGVSRVSADGIKSYGEANGLPGATILVIVQDSTGTLWAGGEKGLFAFDHDSWHKWSPGRGLPDVAVYSALADKNGRLYVGTASGVFRRGAGGGDFEQIEVLDASTEQPGEEGSYGRFQRSFTEDASGRVPAIVKGYPRSFVEDPSGRVLVNDWNVGFHVPGISQANPSLQARGRGFRLLLDRGQNLWIGTIGQGLWRVRHSSGNERRMERATSLTGLPSDGVGALLEDKDGNIWAGSTEGLSRLTPRRITQLTDQGLVVGIERTPDRNIWVATDDALRRFPLGDAESTSVTVPLEGSRLRAMHADERGNIWVATDHYLAQIPSGSSTPRRLQTTASPSIDLITSDFAGGVWMYTQDHRLLRWSQDTITPVALPPAIKDVRIGVLYTDRAGRLWAALADGRVAIRRGDDVFTIYGVPDGLAAGTLRQILEDDEGVVWLAGTGGLSKFADGRFVTVRSDHGFPVSDLNAIAEDDLHNLWIGTGFGVLRITRRDFDDVAAGRAATIPYSSYDRSDGLAGLPHAYNNNRRVVRANDGRLWFVTSRGLSVVDPRAFRENPPRPPINVEYVTANETRLNAIPGLRLSARTSRLEIAYSEVNLSSPLRTRFRHRLEGFDADWVEAGTRRTAFYTNVPPGSYVFRVLASAPDGNYVEPGARFQFSIAPMFYQTMWFRAGIVVLLAVGVWVVWQLRLRQVRQQFALLLGERVRLSRELHDTLLQSLVGVALQFDAIAADVETTDPGRHKHFVRMRKQIEEYIREARQSIWDLRSPRLQRRDLTSALREIGEHVTADHAMQFDMTVRGEPRCSKRIEEQLLRIGQEAVNNVVRHAHATRIRMELVYTDSTVTLHVADDGRGFDQQLAAGAGVDHYGLVSMRERAEDIGGVLEVTSRVNEGTEIRAVVPVAA